MKKYDEVNQMIDDEKERKHKNNFWYSVYDIWID